MKSNKAFRVAAVVIAAICACAALVAVLGQEDSPLDTKLLVVSTGLESSNMLNKLAMQMLKHAGDMPESEMLSKLEAWRNSPDTMLDSLDPVALDADRLTTSGARTQMLVGSIRYVAVLSFVLLFCSRRPLFFPDSDAGVTLGLLLTVTQG